MDTLGYALGMVRAPRSSPTLSGSSAIGMGSGHRVAARRFPTYHFEWQSEQAAIPPKAARTEVAKSVDRPINQSREAHPLGHSCLGELGKARKAITEVASMPGSTR
jgi:hypothetical protein